MKTAASVLTLNGADLGLDPSGALLWPDRRALVVADLHLEKGSSYHRPDGRLLPPYDSAATLGRLETVIARARPETVICLGDSFHDLGAAERLSPEDGARLRALTEGRDWVWVAGNHDPVPSASFGGRVVEELVLAGLVFRHAARADDENVNGEVSGHYHPKAAVRVRGRRVSARCFVADARRLILPAFGAYTGGLSVLDPALRGLLGRRAAVHLLGRAGVYRYGLSAIAG